MAFTNIYSTPCSNKLSWSRCGEWRPPPPPSSSLTSRRPSRQTWRWVSLHKNTGDRVFSFYTSSFLVSGEAGAAENPGGTQAPTARGPEATTATAERRQTTAGQVSAGGCDNDKRESEMRREIKHRHFIMVWMVQFALHTVSQAKWCCLALHYLRKPTFLGHPVYLPLTHCRKQRGTLKADQCQFGAQ